MITEIYQKVTVIAKSKISISPHAGDVKRSAFFIPTLYIFTGYSALRRLRINLITEVEVEEQQ